MAKTSFVSQVNAWAVWFRIIATELERSSVGLTSAELAKVALRSRRLDPGDQSALKDEAKTMSRLLSDLSKWNLVSSGLREPPPPIDLDAQRLVVPASASRIRLPSRISPLPEYVALLRDAGEKLLKRPHWRQCVFFALRLIASFKIWKPLRTAIGVAGVLASVLKVVLLWQSEHALVAASVGGAATFVVQWLNARRP